MKPQKRSVEDVAMEIVTDHIEAEPGIIRIYLFPSDKEVRLIEVDKTVSERREGNKLLPFYFEADEANDLPFPMVVDLIAPSHEELLRKGEICLPANWGNWSEGKCIYQIEESQKRKTA
jgi:hypothetical protein